MIQNRESIHGGILWKIESKCSTGSHSHEFPGQYVVGKRLLKSINIELTYLHFKCSTVIEEQSISIYCYSKFFQYRSFTGNPHTVYKITFFLFSRGLKEYVLNL